ncbi:unnamed protein product [Closterium sp. NIES-65]|nr:unnamed protein product [Closterium sp. NIES-65]
MPIRVRSHAALITVVALIAVASRGVLSQQKPTELTFPLQVSIPSSDPQNLQDLVLLAPRSSQDDRIQIRDAAATVDASATPVPRRYTEDLVSANASPSDEADAYHGAISDHAKEDFVTELSDPETGMPQSASFSNLQSPASPVAATAGEDSNHGEPEPLAVAVQPGQPTSGDISSSAEKRGWIGRPVEVSPTVITTSASASSEVPLTVASLAAPLTTVPARSISTSGAVSPSLHSATFPQPSFEPTPQVSAQSTSAPLTFVRLPATSAQSASSSSPSSPPPLVSVFDPRAFGAAGNGVKDDTAALNAAFAAACAYRAPVPAPRGRAARPTAPTPSSPSGPSFKKQADASDTEPSKPDKRNSGENAVPSAGNRLAASAALASTAAEQGERRVAQQQGSASPARNDGAVASQLTPRQLTTDAAAMPVQGTASGDAGATIPIDAALAPERATLLLPAGRTFLGPRSQIDGLLQFEPNAAKRTGRGAMMVITRVDGLTVAGAGRIDGGGDLLWRRPANSRPHLLLLAEMRRVVVTGITLSNAPMMHLVLRSCVGAAVSGIATRSPGSSPNTDSIHVSACSNVSISDSWLHGGDDDVSIVAGSSGISINNVMCTAGHGISIGSLGYGGKTACVSNVTVTNSVLSGLSNGVRIKTYQGGSGSVFNVRYENITMLNVDRPIVIDQEGHVPRNTIMSVALIDCITSLFLPALRCDNPRLDPMPSPPHPPLLLCLSCLPSSPSPFQPPTPLPQYYCDAEPCGSGVQALSIFNITYTNVTATADATKGRGIIRGIDLACSRIVPCTGISLSQVRIAGSTRGRGAVGNRRVQQSLMESSSLSSFDPASQTAMRLSNAFGARDGRAFPLVDRGAAANLDSAAVDEDATVADALVSAEQRLALAAQRLKCGGRAGASLITGSMDAASQIGPPVDAVNLLAGVEEKASA